MFKSIKFGSGFLNEGTSKSESNSVDEACIEMRTIIYYIVDSILKDDVNMPVDEEVNEWWMWIKRKVIFD